MLANNWIYTYVCRFTSAYQHERREDASGGVEMLCHALCDPVKASNKGIGCIWQALFHVQPSASCLGFHYDNGILI